MKENVLARRYARALFELALEHDTLEIVHPDLNSFIHSLQTNQDLQLLLSSQEIGKKDKINTIEKLLQDKVSKLFYNFIILLLKKNREFLVLRIAREFELLFDKHHKKIRATTITAIPLDTKSMSALKKILDKSFDADVQINNFTDASVLGGMIVNVNGQVFDGSLKSHLRRLQSQLMENSNSHNHN